MMEVTETDGIEGLCYPVNSTGQAQLTTFSSVISVLGVGRDSLHATVDHRSKLLGAGVQVAVPYYPISKPEIARNHVYNQLIQ